MEKKESLTCNMSEGESRHKVADSHLCKEAMQSFNCAPFSLTAQLNISYLNIVISIDTQHLYSTIEESNLHLFSAIQYGWRGNTKPSGIFCPGSILPSDTLTTSNWIICQTDVSSVNRICDTGQSKLSNICWFPSKVYVKTFRSRKCPHALRNSPTLTQDALPRMACHRG